LRDLRDLLRHRVALTRMRSALKNRVGAILAKYGILRPYSDLFGLGGRRFLAALELREGPRRRLDSLVSLIDDFTREIETTSQEIDDRIAKRRGTNVANVAVARKIPTLCFYGLRDGEIRRLTPRGPGAHEQNAGGQRMTRRPAREAATQGSRGSSSELAFVNGLTTPTKATDGRPLD
jgi:hypothetical protein